MTEKEIENKILDWLKFNKIFAWKNQSVGIYDPVKKIYRKPNNKHHIKGTSDILGILPDGKLLAIEVKKPLLKKKRNELELLAQLSDEQFTFIRTVLENNGVAFVADSIDFVAHMLRNYKIKSSDIIH